MLVNHDVESGGKYSSKSATELKCNRGHHSPNAIRSYRLTNSLRVSILIFHGPEQSSKTPPRFSGVNTSAGDHSRHYDISIVYFCLLGQVLSHNIRSSINVSPQDWQFGTGEQALWSRLYKTIAVVHDHLPGQTTILYKIRPCLKQGAKSLCQGRNPAE